MIFYGSLQHIAALDPQRAPHRGFGGAPAPRISMNLTTQWWRVATERTLQWPFICLKDTLDDSGSIMFHLLPVFLDVSIIILAAGTFFSLAALVVSQGLPPTTLQASWEFNTRSLVPACTCLGPVICYRLGEMEALIISYHGFCTTLLWISKEAQFLFSDARQHSAIYQLALILPVWSPWLRALRNLSGYPQKRTLAWATHLRENRFISGKSSSSKLLNTY